MYLRKINNRFMDDFVNEFFGNNNFNPSIVKSNVKETEKSYDLELILPGFKKEDININIDNGILKISSKLENIKDDGYSVKEYHKTSFEKSFELPKDVNVDNINAKMEDGILYITLIKMVETKMVKTIEIA